NEPEVYTNMAYSYGKYPPFKNSYVLYLRVLKNMIAAHKKAYTAIKQVRPGAMIGIAKNYSYYEAYRPNNILDRFLVWSSNAIANHYFLEKISKHMDYVGLNYYFF